MNLKELLQDVDVIKRNVGPDTDITMLTHQSGEAGEGTLFFAVRGESFDGNIFINDVVAKGCRAGVTDAYPQENAPYIYVKDIRAAMSVIAGNFYGNRHRQMKTVAVIGTNGKTTTANMIGEILKAAGKKVTVIGTLGAFVDGKRIASDLTTPDPIFLHGLIHMSAEAGVEYLLYELSAHAIFYKKTEGIVPDVAVFTNFSQDHLDFFGSMEQYKEVKRSFFTAEKARFAVVNADDGLGAEMIAAKEIVMTSYGLHTPADTFALDIEYDRGFRCVVNHCDEVFDLKTNFTGEFNVYNALAAISAARALSVPVETIRKAFRKMEPVSGRFNILESTKRAVVDFAHTPDGLRNLLLAARKICKGKLIAVFGCGGNRDAKKRKIMGRISGELADFTILTSDNSRFENPNDIISQIEQGVQEVTLNYIKIAERENAVTYALLLAGADDLVVIAGKGGEEYMDEQGIKRPYSDTNVVTEVFRRYGI